MVKTQAGFQGKQPLRALQTFLLSVKFSYFVWRYEGFGASLSREKCRGLIGPSRPHRKLLERAWRGFLITLRF